MNRSEVRVEIKSIAANFAGLDWMSHGVEAQADHPDEMSQDPKPARRSLHSARSINALGFIEEAATYMEERGSKGLRGRDRLRSASGVSDWSQEARLTGIPCGLDHGDSQAGFRIFVFPGQIGPVEAGRPGSLRSSRPGWAHHPGQESQMKAQLDRVERPGRIPRLAGGATKYTSTRTRLRRTRPQ